MRFAGWAIALVVFLVSCGGSVETPGEPLRLLSERLPDAFIGEPYQATLKAVGGLRPFTFTLSDGELPPGLELSNGAVVGTPTALGRFTFTVTVSDASLNKTFEDYTLSVVEVPPPTIEFNVPETEIQRELTLRVVVEGRDLKAFRTRMTWDDERFEMVEGSLSHPSDFAVFDTGEPGMLQVDAAVLGAALTGTRQVFSFALRPIEGAPRLALQTETEFLASGRHFFAQATEGAPADVPSEAPVTEDPDADATGSDGAAGGANDAPGDDPDGGQEQSPDGEDPEGDSP